MPTFTGHVSPADCESSSYLYLPFELPAGTERLEVEYEFTAGSILDLGLLDPSTGPFPSRSGFRGWSGSARRSVYVSATGATPGYVAGPLEEGRWQVVLGLAKVAAEGCDYRVEVRYRTARPAAGSWRPGDLQSHTFHSDARGSLADLIVEAEARGLAFLAVTDHNTVSHHADLARLTSEQLILLPGEEVTTYRGHANVWGVEGWIDFRIERPGDLDLLVAQVHERGGLFSINHPKTSPGCIGCDWEHEVPAGADALEAWQGPWAFGNWESLARYDALLTDGRTLTLVGGSDRHHPGSVRTDPPALQLGTPTTWLELAEPTTAAVMAAIRAGRAFVSEGPDGPLVDLRVGGVGMGGALVVEGGPAVLDASAWVRGAEGDVLRWINDGHVIREVEITSPEFTDDWSWQPDGAFVRVEVVAEASLPEFAEQLRVFAAEGRLPPYLSVEDALAHPWRRALSNPVYLR